MTDNLQKLESYLPVDTAAIIIDWIRRTGCQFRVAKSRKSKFGDYRHPWKDHGHRISVNDDLNPYAFLITTVHEFAHLKTWNEHQNRVAPHGQEWKDNFRQLMAVIMRHQVLPQDVTLAVQAYLENPAASSCTDLNLFRVLKTYDHSSDQQADSVLVETMAEGEHFVLRNGRVFRRMEKLRKRFRCVEIATQKVYLFSPIAEVTPHQAENSATRQNETYTQAFRKY